MCTEFLGQKHSKAGVKKKSNEMATSSASRDVSMKKGSPAVPGRATKRPAVAARKAKALLAAGKVPPAAALAVLKKKQKQDRQAKKNHRKA